MNITIEINDNTKAEEVKEFELEDIIYYEIQKLKSKIDSEHKELEVCYNTLNVDELTVHSIRYRELIHKLRLLQSILCKYYNKQICKNL